MTLESELQSERVLEWIHQLARNMDALASLVDPRETGILTHDSPATFDRVALATSAIKAGLQMLLVPAHHTSFPKFAIEAERYLAEMPRGVPVTVGDSKALFQTGPVAHRRGARGAGRLAAVAELIATLVEPMLALSQEDLHQHLECYWARKELSKAVYTDGQSLDERVAAHESFKRRAPIPEAGWVLPERVGYDIFMDIVYGTFIDLLRDQDFRWDGLSPELFTDVAARFFEDMDIGSATAESAESRRPGLEKIARQLVLTCLRQVGIKAGAKLFRGLPG